MTDAEIAEIGQVDVVVGLVPATWDREALEGAVARISAGALSARSVLVHPPYAPADATPLQTSREWRLITSQQLAQNPANIVDSLKESFRGIAEISRKLGARACGLIASDLSSVRAEWVQLLLAPVVEDDFDLVTPCYARHAFEGMINRALVYPFFRALYGKKLRNPLGPDLGISRRLLDRVDAGARPGLHPFASLGPEAASNGMKICQAHLGHRTYSPPDSTALSSLLSQVLGPVFLDTERYAPAWQRVRGSQLVPEFGTPMSAAGTESAVDVTRMIESFRLGVKNLYEVWAMILPPSTLVELHHLARKDSSAFLMLDETWARIVYDFALAHRLRTISREQVLRSLTPLYLGWLASYANQPGSQAPEAVEQRLEKLCLAYEHTKSYFVSRWRWPDRFNP